MIYAVEYSDGNIYTSSEYAWCKLPRDKDITSLIVYDADEQMHQLTDFDVWFFSDEATYSNKFGYSWEARVIGGFHSDTGQGTICRVFPNGGYNEISANLSEYKNNFSEKAFIENVYAAG